MVFKISQSLEIFWLQLVLLGVLPFFGLLHFFRILLVGVKKCFYRILLVAV